MDRLRDDAGETDPARAHAARLLQSATLPEPSDARAERVWNALRFARDRRRKPAWRVAVVAVLAFVGIASVAWASVAAVRKLLAHHRAANPLAAAASTPAPRLPAPPPVSAPSPAPPLAPREAPAVAPPLEEAARAPLRNPLRAPAPRHTGAEKALPAVAHASRGDAGEAPHNLELAIVTSAAHALRREHDPARATVLLDDYLQRFPDGTLVEEALVLAIEAAATQEDPSAAEYGRRYLQLFPHGRFRNLAEKAVRRFDKGETR